MPVRATGFGTEGCGQVKSLSGSRLNWHTDTIVFQEIDLRGQSAEVVHVLSLRRFNSKYQDNHTALTQSQYQGKKKIVIFFIC